MKTFTKQLFDARTHRGLTQQEAADLLGLSRRHYIDLEKGYAKPSEALMAGMLGLLRQKPVKGKGMAKAGILAS